MPAKSKSGAQKRKEMKEELEKSAKLPKISRFFPRIESSDTDPNNSCIDECTDIQQDSAASTSSEINKECEIQDDSGELDRRDVLNEDESANYRIEEHPEESVQCSGSKYPTDRGDFQTDIIDNKTKRFIISQGSCKPKGIFPRDEKQGGRCFSETYYTMKTKAGISIPRVWLCYSPKLDSVYCEPCWLFADRNSNAYNAAWVTGVRDWRHLTDKISTHEKSQQHLNACIVFQHWRTHGTVDEENEREILKAKNFWRQVLDRLINITLTMSMCNLPFRGHREVLGDVNNGNFLSIVELLAKYDPVLKQLISMPKAKGSIRYLSHKIQDEIIELLSKTIENQIVDEIKAAPFFSIIMDTTQDISKTDQLSQVFRYVKLESNELNSVTSVKIKESFLGFHAISDQTAAGLEKEIVNCIEGKGLELSKCRGQGYDGAANMSGVYAGVQARISRREPSAEYVHCAAHNLNLALNDCVQGIPEIKQFYDVLERMYTFFGHSVKRWAMLSEFASLSDPEVGSNVTLKRLCPTRWSSRNDSLTALRFRYKDIMKALTKIILLSKNKDECNEAAALKKMLGSFEFVVQIVVQKKIVETVNSVSKCLQSKQSNLENAAKLINNAIESLTLFRNNFDEAKDIAIKISEQWKVEAKFVSKRRIRIKKQFDELCEDERLNDPERFFKVNIFYGCLDIIVAQLSNRFKSLDATVKKFKAILPSTLVTATDDQLYEEAEQLIKYFSKDFTGSFSGQLLAFRACLKPDISKLSTVEDLAKLLITENSVLSSSFPEVCTAIILFLSIPVTVATAERSFSKLKIIKNYLRSTMGQERLKGLAMLSIENERAKNLQLEKIIDEFADRKARKMNFH